MNLSHLGGENTVTGSCHLLRANGVTILVDCGLAQGEGLMSDVRGQMSEVGGRTGEDDSDDLDGWRDGVE